MTLTTDTELFSDDEWTLLKRDLRLTPRQAEIVRHIAHGLSDKQIARQLEISVPTVRTHMGRLFDKFDLSDRLELLVLVFASLREYWKKDEGPLS
jgi:DNA-binding CsgD family transcriptional regulator